MDNECLKTKLLLSEALEKLRVAQKALRDIANWDDDMEDEYEDQGYRAVSALLKIKTISHLE